LISLLVCLIPTTIGGLLSAIGIGGISRLLKKNVLALSGRAIEAAGDIDVLLLDKTGTITLGNRMAVAFMPTPGVAERELAEAAQAASFPDETPEGRSIVVLAKKRFGLRGRDGAPRSGKFVPFSAVTRMSGLDLIDANGGVEHVLRKGAVESIKSFVEKNGGMVPHAVQLAAQEIARSGGTPILVARDNKVLGAVHLKDVIKGGIKERFARLRKMGIRTIMITGDNPLTAAAIAAEAGVDDFVAEATPESKLAKINSEKEAGHLVAMTGDGTNDAPALAQADVGVAMHTGTQAAREAGNMIDLDSNPTKLIDIVETGKQILMTRGALTTFSFANDISKYFAILPAMFGMAYGAQGKQGPLAVFNVMNLYSPQSAVLSAVIFNALIIVLLIPLALRGVTYRPGGTAAMLRRNLLIYGLGGILSPFIGIKIIDVIIQFIGIPL
jgi:K+-transporting ATPase ATPase B chain